MARTLRNPAGSRWTRRRFLGAAGGAALAAAGGGAYGLYRLFSSPGGGPGAHAFHSRPDLRPPEVEIVRRGRDRPAGYVFYTPMGGPGQTGALIFDDDGQPVWFQPAPKGKSILDLRVQTYRGQPVLTWWEGSVGKGYGRGEGVIADTSYRELARVRGHRGTRPDLHEFQLTDAGTALVTSYQTVERTLAGRRLQVIDGIVQELDVASGDLLFDWHSLDHVALDESHRAPSGSHFDYFHGNSIDVDADGNLLVSARHTWAVYKLDRKTGAVIWRLGGTRSDFELGPGVRFAWQHDARRVPDGSITIFDDGAKPKVEPQSRAIVLDVDERTMRASLVRAYTDGQLATAMGNMQTLEGGGIFVGWGTEPIVSQFARDGTRRFQARLAKGAHSYRAYRDGWRATPPGRPALAARRGDDRDRLYASWNGATDVALWRVEAGPAPSALATIADVPRHGFETEIRLRRRFRHARIAALDADGAVLGRSQTIALDP